MSAVGRACLIDVPISGQDMRCCPRRPKIPAPGTIQDFLNQLPPNLCTFNAIVSSSKLVSALLGLSVHDLRNPLSALQSNLGFLRSQVDLKPEVHEALDDVGVSCEALSRI